MCPASVKRRAAASATVGLMPNGRISVSSATQDLGTEVVCVAAELETPGPWQAMLREVVPDRERGRAFGVQGSVLGVGAGLGPVIGGLATAAFGWRAIFGVNLPVVLGVLYVLQFFADKVPWVDSLWDAVHTFIRPLGGAFLAIRVLGPTDPTIEVIAAGWDKSVLTALTTAFDAGADMCGILMRSSAKGRPSCNTTSIPALGL